MASRPRSLPVLLLSAAVLAPTLAYTAPPNLPDLGDASAAVMSPHEERKLGEQIMREIRSSLEFLDDPEINQYVQGLGQKLAGHSGVSGPTFEFFAIADPTINAFALPGGFIGMHTGLLLAAQSESEVAAVLAHEVAHITQRHIHRMIAESQRTSKQVLAALLAGLVLAGSGEGQAGEAAIALATAGGIQKQLNFTRAHEEEADRVGMQILAASGLDPLAMPAFFERLQAWGRLNESNLPEFLRTHPITTARIAESRNRAEHYKYRQIPDSIEFHRVRAKLRATGKGDVNEIARNFEQNLAAGKYRNLEAERYGYALALLRSQRYDAARRIADTLLNERPDALPYLVLRAEIELGAGDSAKGLGYYAEASRKFPTSIVLTRYHAAALLKTGRARDARELVRKGLSQYPDDPTLHKMLATAAGESGELFEAHRALAAYYYLNGNPGAALQQLHIAKRFASGNEYLSAGVNARIKEIEQELAGQRKN